jgi:hypothetical protein
MARKLKGKDPTTAKPSKPKILVYGKPGVGKTWTSLDFPSVYYIDTEGGADLAHYTAKLKASGGAYLGPADGSNDFTTVIDEIITLATTDHDYRTLVIDSYSKLFNTSIDIEYQRMQDAGRDMDKTFGAEKKPAIAYTRRMVRWFERLDMNVIMICHQKDLWKNGEQVGVTFDGWDKLEYELHLALNISKQGNSRKARVVKSRLEGFPEPDQFDWSYTAFADKFGRTILEGKSTKLVLASDKQVKEIENLIEVLRVDQEIIDKWYTKAGVEAFDEMDSELITKCIEFLRAKLPADAKS